MARPAKKVPAKVIVGQVSSEPQAMREVENKSVVDSDPFALVEERLNSHLQIREREAKILRDGEEWELRKSAAKRLLLVFLIANGVSLAALIVAWWTDSVNIAADKTYVQHRIIDKDVMMALLAATTIQLGTVAVIISNWLFSRDRK